MFSKKLEPESEGAIPMARPSAPSSSTFSVIGADVTIKGDVSASTELHVDGRIEGDITCESLVQGETSVIDGAISAETDDGLARARWLAEVLGLRAFVISDADRTLYHAAAVIGGNFLVTLHQVATRLLAEAGAPPEAIVPLMRRTIENEFDLTGPIARGDWSTVVAHLDTLEQRAPDLVPLYRALAEATRR